MGNLQKTKNLILNFNGESKYQQLQKSLFPLNLSTICPIALIHTNPQNFNRFF